MSTRIHVVIPKELADEIDSLVTERARSSFICDTLRERVIREKQIRALERLKTRAPFKGGPKEWESDSAGWVRRLRQENEEIRGKRLRKND